MSPLRQKAARERDQFFIYQARVEHLSLVATLFGVAVLFVAQQAHLLAAVQVIVYAGAIVVLFVALAALWPLQAHALFGDDARDALGAEASLAARNIAGGTGTDTANYSASASGVTVDLNTGDAGLRSVQARFVGPWQSEMQPGPRWQVSAKLEVR